MISKKQKKFLIIGFTICALLGSGYTASAVYPVHDSRVYAQIVAQIKKVTEQINTIKQQIALQKQHLYDLGWGKIGPIIKDIQQHRDEYAKLRGSVSGILSGAKDVQKSFKETFRDFDDFNVKTESYSSLKARMEYNRQKISKLDRETVLLINHKQKELDASQKRILKLTEELKTAKGSKDLGQIQALIDAETVYSQNLSNDIDSLNTKLAVIRNEINKLEHDAADKANELLANDFGSAAKQMREIADKEAGVTTLTPKFDALVDETKWK